MGNPLKTRLFGEGSTNSVGLGAVVDWLLLASEKEKAAIRAIVTDPRSGLGAGSPPAPDQADLAAQTARRLTALEDSDLRCQSSQEALCRHVHDHTKAILALKASATVAPPPRKAKAKNGSSKITQASVELANLA